VEHGRIGPAAEVQVQAWMAILVVTRELTITGLRLLAAAQNVVLAAERYGKHKTVSQIVALIALLALAARGEWPEWLQAIFLPWLPWFARVALWVAVGLTVSSGAMYLWRNRDLYLKDV
jgi:phosphatidylglycerophosphate synthase